MMMTTSKSIQKFTTVRVTYPHRFFTPEDQEWLSLVFSGYTSLGFSVHYLPHDDYTQILEWIFQEQVEGDVVSSLFEQAAEMFGREDLLKFGAFDVEKMDDRDWLAHVYRANPPRRIGQFCVFDSASTTETDVNMDGLVPLDITAATAFGSGAHGTTHGCLEFLSELQKSGFAPAKTLDVGTGSGILVIGAALLWEKSALYATDNDPECLIVTQRHLERNDVQRNVRLTLSEGFDEAEIAQSGPYDLILANILPSPLVGMAGDIATNCAQSGKIILSGIPEAESARVEEAYSAQGLNLSDKKIVDSWASLLFSKPAL